MFLYYQNDRNVRTKTKQLYSPTLDVLVANLSFVADRTDTDIFLILGDFSRPNISWIRKGNTLEPVSYDNKSIDFIANCSYFNFMQFNSIPIQILDILVIIMRLQDYFVKVITL